jgi:hypothetical protein
MRKLFSPKEYGFIGFFLGLPTVLYASMKNGKELEVSHPQILRTAKMLLGFFAALVLLMIALDVVNLLQIQNTDNHYVGTQMITRFSTYFSYISWGFLVIQLILIVVLVAKTNKSELPIYNELKQSGQLTHRSNAPLIGIGILSWVVFWGYGFLIRILADYLAFGSILG